MSIANCRKIFKSLLFKKSAFARDVTLDGNSLRLSDLTSIGSGLCKVNISPSAWNQVISARTFVEKLLEDKSKVSYGINTGFGRFSNIVVPDNDLIQLQYNLIRSHSVGTGPPISLNASRRLHALRINTLAKGFSGIHPKTLQGLVDLFNSGAVAKIPLKGTVGASGDLAPLAFLALALIGEGQVWDAERLSFENCNEVFQKLNLQPVKLQTKDGLSLINGTQFISAFGSIALEQAINLMQQSIPIAALSLIAMKGIPSAFDARIHQARGHPGQEVVAELMRFLVQKSEISQEDTQDSYSTRCIPQVYGVVLENIQRTLEILETEFNAATDNPLVVQGEILSGGNFHGEYPAKALDSLALHLYELGSMSFQRIRRLVSSDKSKGLPSFLVRSKGLNSGVMLWEYCAAALLAENRTLVNPASVDSHSTCADKEDHVSMGGWAARKACDLFENLNEILTIELLCAIQALQMRQEKEDNFIEKNVKNEALKKIYQELSLITPPLVQDRYTKTEFDLLSKKVRSGYLWNTIQEIYQGNLKLNEENFFSTKAQNECYLKAPQLTEDKNLIFTKVRKFQTQLGQLKNNFYGDQEVNFQKLKQALQNKKAEQKGDDVYVVLDNSQDEIGVKANYGRANFDFTESAYVQFLQKFVNFQVNEENQKSINKFYLLGSVDLDDLVEKCKTLRPAISEERKLLIESVKEVAKRACALITPVFDSGCKLIYMNGGHNNMFHVVKSYFDSKKQQVILVHLDFHSDLRLSEDGPHSGTWMSECFENGYVKDCYIIGLGSVNNSQVCIESLDKHGVTFRDYMWEKIYNWKNGNPLQEISQQIVQKIKAKHGDNVPVVISIDCDSITGLPTSAQNEMIGYPVEQVYPMITEINKNLEVVAFASAELNPSLDKTKNQASGEFLAYSALLVASKNKKH